MMRAEDIKRRPSLNTPEEALQHLAAQYTSYRKVATLSYSMSNKTTALGEIEYTLGELKRAVAGSRAVDQDETATCWRKVQEFVEALRYELTMWIQLDEHKYGDAWDTLVAAQDSASCALRWLPDFEPAQHLEDHLTAVERVVFPKQLFFSPSWIINEADVECTICHMHGGQCDHIAGDIYRGEVAGRLIHDVRHTREISIVDNPANKRARAISYDGVDLLTGTPIETG